MLVQKILFNYRDNKKKRIQLIKTKFFSNLLNIFKPDQIRVPLFLFVLSSLKQSKQDPNLAERFSRRNELERTKKHRI